MKAESLQELERMYRIEEFSDKAEPEFLVMTQHSRKRLQERAITIDDI